MQDACHITVESLWLNGRVSERGIRRSEVRFLMSKIVVAALNVYIVEPETSNYDVLIRG